MQTHLMHLQHMRTVTSVVVPEDLAEHWRDLLAQHARTTVALDEALDEFGLGMSEFEILERLACDCGEQPRMLELMAAAHLSQSALSRTVGRLEKEGLVQRAMCPEDRRGIKVCLTPEGRERYEAARPTHRRVLAENLGA
jgi:DNA-binding MarR family transcriptional regulator